MQEAQSLYVLLVTPQSAVPGLCALILQGRPTSRRTDIPTFYRTTTGLAEPHHLKRNAYRFGISLVLSLNYINATATMLDRS